MGVLVMNYLLFFFSILVASPVAFFIGYKFRTFIPKAKRFNLGFIISFTMLAVLLGLDLLFALNISQTGIGTAIAIGFPLGLAGPPYYD